MQGKAFRETQEQSKYTYNGPQSMTWKIEKEAIFVLGSMRAILMQLAHPLIAIGSDTHSCLMSDPFGRAKRTFTLSQKFAFGSDAMVHDAARSINRLHTHVHGALPIEAGAYAKGTPYKARDPELLLWAHACWVDTVLLTYSLFFGPLSSAEKDQYYQESKMRVRLLGLPTHAMPETMRDVEQYLNDMLHSNRLAATPQARRLVHKALFPSSSVWLRPLMHLNRSITCALLPPSIREIYGLQWDTRQQRTFDLFVQAVRAVLPYLPRYLRELPSARSMMRQERASRCPLR